MVTWYGLTVPWLKAEKVWFMSSCTPFINRTITEEVPWFRGGNHQDWRGIQISFVLCPWVFFYDEHTPCKLPCLNLALFWVHLPYLGDYVHFLGINYAHNSNWNNWCLKTCTRTVWKNHIVVFSNFSSLLQGMGGDFNGMRGNSQPQTRHLLGYQLYIDQWNMCLKNMTTGVVPWYGLTMPL